MVLSDDNDMLSAAQVEQDGTFKFVDMCNRGGRTFFGLGTLLTGYKATKTFAVIMHFIACVCSLMRLY